MASRLDPCALNMAKYIIDSYNAKQIDKGIYKVDYGKIAIIDDEATKAEWLDRVFNVELYIFLSMHRSESNIPTLTSHFTGNFSTNTDMGGNAKELCYTFPSLQKHYMQELYSKSDLLKDYQIVIEATHHGPTRLSKPLLFVEIGSTLTQWYDAKAISLVCDTILSTLRNVRRAERISIAIGGTHYPSKFNKLIIESEYAIGHIASKHVLIHLDEYLLDSMINKSIEKVDSVILDWKGLSKEKERIINLVKRLELEVIRV